MLTILLEFVLNALFMAAVPKAGCGDLSTNDKIVEMLVEASVQIITTAVVAAPLLVVIASLLHINPKYQKWIKTAPISFKT